MGPRTMKIYCAGSMRGGGKWAKNLDHIARIVEELGHVALTEVTDNKHMDIEAEGHGDTWIYNRDMKWLRMSDCLIAEVSSPSLGVGYEIAVMVHETNKPVLCLYHESVATLSAMIHGNSDPLMTLKHYNNIDEMKVVIKDFLSKIIDTLS